MLTALSAIISYRTSTISLGIPDVIAKKSTFVSTPRTPPTSNVSVDAHMELLSSAMAMLSVGKSVIVPPSTSMVIRLSNPVISEHQLMSDPAEIQLQTLGLLSCASVSDGQSE
jgi:hypothetical protein